MPSANPFAPLVDVGGGATVGPVSGSASLAVDDHHATAGIALSGLVLLLLLWKSKFRFSTTVG